MDPLCWCLGVDVHVFCVYMRGVSACPCSVHGFHKQYYSQTQLSQYIKVDIPSIHIRLSISQELCVYLRLILFSILGKVFFIH